MEAPEIDAIRERARLALTKLPGVLWVGFGTKETDGRPTSKLALRVYVADKRPRADIPDSEIIPDEFEGIPTDVIRISSSNPEGMEDRSRHSPLISGITITNRKTDPAPAPQGFELGTIGFFATLAGMASRDNVYLVSNHHVLGAKSAAVGDTIYQPGFVPTGIDPEVLGAIGKNEDVGAQTHHMFQDQGDAAPQSYFVDCALAKLDISISSWCNCNCGASYRNRLFDFEGQPNDKIEGTARAAANGAVSKSGRSTGRTHGTVLDTNGAVMISDIGLLATNILIITPNAPEQFFSGSGDSGSAVIDDQNRLVGLHFGSNRASVQADIDNNVVPPRMHEAHSCHIGAVLDYLGTRAGAALTPISTQNPPIGPAGKTRSGVHATLIDDADHTMFLQERALRTEAGARIYGGFLEHRDEILALVNQCRPVLSRWHRGKGPAYVAHLAESARSPGHAIPVELEGQSRARLLADMADLLTQYGSPALAGYIRAHRAEALHLARDIGDLHLFVASLEKESVDG